MPLKIFNRKSMVCDSLIISKQFLTMCNNNFISDNVLDENFGPDINVKFDNLKLNDEKILCQFYKGPPDTTCFKGDRCKKIHKLFNKGWKFMVNFQI